jgi:hypothetical protein
MDKVCRDTLLSLRYSFFAPDYTTGPAHSTIVDPYSHRPRGKTESKTYVYVDGLWNGHID